MESSTNRCSVSWVKNPLIVLDDADVAKAAAACALGALAPPASGVRQRLEPLSCTMWRMLLWNRSLHLGSKYDPATP